MRAWMIGAYSLPPYDPNNPRSTAPPNGPQPNTAWFACKNVNDIALINHDPYTGCYKDHQNAAETADVPDSTRATLSCNNLPFGSQHKGSLANFCFGDGSVQFVDEAIDVKMYLAMASRNGEEALSQ